MTSDTSPKRSKTIHEEAWDPLGRTQRATPPVLLGAPESLGAPARRKSLTRDCVRAGGIFAALFLASLLWVWFAFVVMPDPHALARTAGVDPETVLLRLPRCAHVPLKSLC